MTKKHEKKKKRERLNFIDPTLGKQLLEDLGVCVFLQFLSISGLCSTEQE